MEQPSLQIATQIGLTLLAAVVYLVLLTLTQAAVGAFGRRQLFVEKRIVYTKKFFKLCYFTLLLLALIVIWGIDVRGILIFASSFFALVGMALFAGWSVLSSLTASIILFFYFPYRIGDRIRMLDGDNSVTGIILDMTLFYVQVETDAGDLVALPNNLVIQKAVSSARREEMGADEATTIAPAVQE